MNTEKATLFQVDWPVLRGALIVSTLSLLLSALLIVASQYYQSSQETLRDRENRMLERVKEEYNKVKSALELVDKGYKESYNALTKQGFFQEKTTLNMEERRLQMVAEIKSIISELKFPTPTTYEVAEQTLYVVPGISVEPQLKTYETKLILKMGLLHEENLLKLIAAIEFQQLPGLFNLQKCELNRIQEVIDVKSTVKANIDASCVLSWYVSAVQQEEDEVQK